MSDYKCPYCKKFLTGHLKRTGLSIDDLTCCPHCDGDLLASPPFSSPRQYLCPRCGSANLTGDKKGFGLGKAVVGGVLLGGVGLLGGFIGSRKIMVSCMQCGHAWEAGKQ